MSRRVWWTLLLALVAVTAAAFLPVLRNGLVWDDWPNVGRNTHFRGLGAEQLRWAFTNFRQGHYQPLTWISYGLDHVVWGTDYAGYHLTNLLLHLVNAVLFGWLAERLIRLTRRHEPHAPRFALGSLLATAVFALHPMRVESVSWVTERRHLLAATFFLLAVLAYLAAWRAVGRGRPAPWGAGAVTALYGLSLLSTPLGIALPLVLLVLDAYPLGRLGPGFDARRLAALAIEKWPLWFLSALFTVSSLAAQQASGALLEAGRYDAAQRLAQAAYGALYYPRAIFATRWYPLYERPYLLNPLEPRFLISAALFVVVSVALIRARRRFPAALAVWAAYLLLLTPVSGLAQSGIQLVADRYSYLAGMGFALLLGALGARWWRNCRGAVERTIWAVAVVVVLVFWTAATWTYAGVWRDDATLWRHTLSGGPSALASTHLAEIAERRGDTGSALRHARLAIETAPTYGRAWVQMRGVLEQENVAWDRQELMRAVSVLDAALGYQSAATAWYITGLARIRLGEFEEAEEMLERSILIRSDLPETWLRLGEARARAGRFDDAADAFAEATRLDPRDAAAWTRLALALASTGRKGAAVEALREGVGRNPENRRLRELLEELRDSDPPH